MLKKKIKNFGIGIDRTATLERVDALKDSGENRAEEVVRHHKEAVDILCATGSKEPIDKENERKFKLKWWLGFRRGVNRSSKKVISDLENENLK